MKTLAIVMLLSASTARHHRHAPQSYSLFADGVGENEDLGFRVHLPEDRQSLAAPTSPFRDDAHFIDRTKPLGGAITAGPWNQIPGVQNKLYKSRTQEPLGGVVSAGPHNQFEDIQGKQGHSDQQNANQKSNKIIRREAPANSTTAATKLRSRGDCGCGLNQQERPGGGIVAASPCNQFGGPPRIQGPSAPQFSDDV